MILLLIFYKNVLFLYLSAYIFFSNIFKLTGFRVASTLIFHFYPNLSVLIKYLITAMK